MTDATSNKKPRRHPRRADAPQTQTASSANATAPVRKVHPMLEQLASLHPKLFGARFLPLKLGIFEDLLARHGELLARDELKIALGLHARSTRYLECVASGLPRHDLDGQPVEPIATEHRHHAILEVFRRRQNRTDPAPRQSWHADPRERARSRLMATIEASGLSHIDYRARMPATRDEASIQLLDEAFAELRQQSARREALLRAFDLSGNTEAEFAEMYGMTLDEVHIMLERARNERATQPSTELPEIC